jgi:hypothetical protein
MKSTALFLFALICGACHTCLSQTYKKGTFYRNTEHLADECRSAIRIHDNDSPSPDVNKLLTDTQDGNRCLGYVSGVADEFESEGLEDVKHPLGSICLPEGVSSVQLVKIFLKFADAHPEQLHYAAPTVIWNSLIDVFPCPVK